MQRLLWSVLVLCALAISASFAGALHPAGDSLAVFRVPLAVIGVILSCFVKPKPYRAVFILVTTLTLLPYGWAALRPDWAGPARLTLYQQNLLFSRQDNDAWLRAVREKSPDIITLQEVSTRNLPLMQALRTQYPHQLHCPLWDILGEAVLSRHPFIAGTERCSERDGLAAVQIDAPDGPLWVVSLHVSWPWPHGQAQQLTDVLPMLSDVTGAVIVAGDFNAVAWSHAVARVERTTGTKRIGQVRRTFNLPYGGWPVAIDHVLATGKGRILVQPKLGSDHHGLWAALNPWSDLRQ